MSSNTENNTKTIYAYPRDCTKWSHDFRDKARGLELWDYIDPDTLSPWPTKPTPLNLANYPKKLVRVETRASSSTAQSQIQTPSQTTDEVDPRNPPTSVTEMTTEGRASYQLDWSIYMFQAKEYKDHTGNRKKLISWIQSTTSPMIREICCKEGETLDKWYEAFLETGSAYERNRIPDARAKYKASVKPLLRLPRSFETWLTEWETALSEGQNLNVPETSQAQFWAEDLANTLKSVLPVWAANFITNNKEKIQDDTLSYREVATDLRRTW